MSRPCPAPSFTPPATLPATLAATRAATPPSARRPVVGGAWLAAAALLLPAAPAAAGTASLSTTYAAGNAHHGNMFEVTAAVDLEIYHLGIYTAYGGTTCYWTLFTSSSSFISVASDPTQWDLAGSGTLVSGTSFVEEDFIIVPTAPIALSAGSSLSLYVTLEGDCGLSYTDGSEAGAVYASDANLSITEGYGVVYPFLDIYSPRVWNGTIYYETCDAGYADLDGDLYGDPAAPGCYFSGEGSADNTDCDDADPLAYPGAADAWYDGVDGDCAGDNDFDADMDGFESDAHGGDDCDDANGEVSPGAEEVWYDGVDGDCAGDDDNDADGDGFASADHGGDDCDDAAAGSNPGAEDLPDDGVDQDCDGADATSDGADGADGGADGGTDGAADGGADGGKTGCAVGGGGPAPAWGLLGLALAALGRRRRR